MLASVRIHVDVNFNIHCFEDIVQKFMSQILLSYLSYDHVSNACVGKTFEDFVFENQCSSNEVPKGKVTKNKC